jgi:hypothetical protein
MTTNDWRTAPKTCNRLQELQGCSGRLNRSAIPEARNRADPQTPGMADSLAGFLPRRCKEREETCSSLLRWRANALAERMKSARLVIAVSEPRRSRSETIHHEKDEVHENRIDGARQELPVKVEVADF